MFLAPWQAQVRLKVALIKQVKIALKGRRRRSASERKISEIGRAPFPARPKILCAPKDPFIIG